MFDRLFKGDKEFYRLLKDSAEEARHCASLLDDVLAHLGGDCSAQLESIRENRRKQKRLAQEITLKLCQLKSTDLDRDDIEALNRALHRIPKAVEKIAGRLAICPVKFTSRIVPEQVHLLRDATRELSAMATGLAQGIKLPEMEAMNARLQHIEGDADKTLTALLGELYNQQVDPIEVLLLKDVYELIERAIDRCRDAGNALFRMVLKFS